MTLTARLHIDAHFCDHTLVVQPVGELAPETYERLRDQLLAYAAEEPAGIVVDLANMEAAISSLLTVFPTVGDRISDWPGVPLVLAAPQGVRALLDLSAVPRFVPTYHSVNDALQGLDAAPRHRRRQMRLACDPASGRLARRLVAQTCREWGISGIISDAMVVASELADNMVHHARSEGWLRLALRGKMLTVAVADADPRLPRLRVPGLRAAGGRGLVLVDKLSRKWGTASRFPHGKVVWAILTVNPQTRTAPNPASST